MQRKRAWWMRFWRGCEIWEMGFSTFAEFSFILQCGTCASQPALQRAAQQLDRPTARQPNSNLAQQLHSNTAHSTQHTAHIHTTHTPSTHSTHRHTVQLSSRCVSSVPAATSRRSSRAQGGSEETRAVTCQSRIERTYRSRNAERNHRMAPGKAAGGEQRNQRDGHVGRLDRVGSSLWPIHHIRCPRLLAAGVLSWRELVRNVEARRGLCMFKEPHRQEPRPDATHATLRPQLSNPSNQNGRRLTHRQRQTPALA